MPDALGPVKGTEELWYLLTALDTLIFCLAVAVIKDQGVIVQARREIQPYTSQLSDPKAEEAFNAALKSSEGQRGSTRTRPPSATPRGKSTPC